MKKRLLTTAVGLGIAAAIGVGIVATTSATSVPAGASVQTTAGYTFNGFTFTESELVNGKPRVPAELRGQQISLWHEAWNKAKSAYERDRNAARASEQAVPIPAQPSVRPVPQEPWTDESTVKTYTVNGFVFTEADLKQGKPRVPAELRGQQISRWHEAWNKAKSAYERELHGR